MAYRYTGIVYMQLSTDLEVGVSSSNINQVIEAHPNVPFTRCDCEFTSTTLKV